MLRILAGGPFVPSEIKNSRNNYDNFKKRKTKNSSVNFHSNISNKNTDYMSSNNYNNYTNNKNSKRNKKKKFGDDYLNEFIKNVTKGKKQNKINKLARYNFVFKDISLNDKNISVPNISNQNENRDSSKKKENNNYNLQEIKNSENYIDPNNINRINNNNNIDLLNAIEDLNLNNEHQDNKDYINSKDKENNQNHIENHNLQSMDLNNYCSEKIINNNYFINEGQMKNPLSQSTGHFKKVVKNRNNNRMRSLSSKVKTIRNFEKYNTLINNKKMEKAELQKSISNLENSIKLFKNDTKLKDKECVKLLHDNKKMTINNEINKEKIKEYECIQNNIKQNNIKYKEIRNETNAINETIMKIKNEIEEMNIKIKILKKKIIDEEKNCEKMRKDININKNHSNNLKQKIKIFDDNHKNVEEIIDNMNRTHI